MEYEPGRPERDSQIKSSWVRLELYDGAWGEHWVGGVLGAGPCRAHGMRGDGVGVGDIGEVPDRTRDSQHTSHGDDCRGSGREHVAGVVIGH